MGGLDSPLAPEIPARVSKNEKTNSKKLSKTFLTGKRLKIL